MIKPYYETKLGKLYHGDCLEIMLELDPVDLVLTSPPYDNLRDYGGYKFNFKKTAKHIFNNIKQGGIVIWVVGDATINGNETGTSFKHALYFKEIGFYLHDTMIWNKPFIVPKPSNRYECSFEYMFVFSKGKPGTVNLIKDKVNKGSGRKISGHKRGVNGTPVKLHGAKIGKIVSDFGTRHNVWDVDAARGMKGHNHPAPFPEALARDHIISWSNENDVVLDPMCGSGTTLKQCERLKRKWIGIEISEEYCEIAAKRIEENLTAMERIERSEKGITKKTGLLF